jgi:uncharacterized membrane protein
MYGRAPPVRSKHEPMNRELKELLQGRWLGHPLHPALAHIPTALFPAAMVFDLLAWYARSGNAAFARTSFWCILVGLLAVLAVVPTGLADFSEIKPEKPARRIGWVHMILNVIVSVLFLINLVLRWQNPQIVALVPLWLSIIGTVILLYSGWLGGRMVYEYGIGVARQSKGVYRKLAQAGGAKMPDQNGGG